MIDSSKILRSHEVGAQVETIIAKVIDNRDNHTPLHPMTTALHSSIFNIEELAEEDDAVMRNLPQYKRNNAKEIDAEMELGDAFYMAATTIMALERGLIEDDIDRHAERLKAMSAIKANEARALIADGYYDEAEDTITQSMRYLIAYCEHKGIDPLAALEKSSEKFRRKFGAKDE